MDKMLNIGLGAIVPSGRIIAMLAPDSAPVKRLMTDARERGMLIDATFGRRTRAVIVMDSDHVILSSLLPDTLASRINAKTVEE